MGDDFSETKGKEVPVMRVARSTQEVESLATRMAASEELAYAEFADTYGPRIRSFLLRRGLSSADAEDLAVSCVTDIALKVEKYRAMKPGGFDAWVFTIARHQLIDWIRSRKNTESLPDNLAAPAPPDPDIVPDIEASQAVNEAISQLSKNDQLIVRLRHLVEERTYAEIGEQLNISTETARVRHFRALKRLKSILESDVRIGRRLLRSKNKTGEGL
jgi:RNA polymerase sigma-70 factor (ECF subfamily)